MEIVVLDGIGTGRGGGLVAGRVLPPPLSAGFVAVKSVIAGELESFFRDKCGQGGKGVQRVSLRKRAGNLLLRGTNDLHRGQKRPTRFKVVINQRSLDSNATPVPSILPDVVPFRYCVWIPNQKRFECSKATLAPAVP